jgi:hypothetical protein
LGDPSAATTMAVVGSGNSTVDVGSVISEHSTVLPPVEVLPPAVADEDEDEVSDDIRRMTRACMETVGLVAPEAAAAAAAAATAAEDEDEAPVVDVDDEISSF